MPRKLTPLAFAEQVLKPYASGEGMESIAARLSMNPKTLYTRIGRYRRGHDIAAPTGSWAAQLVLPGDPGVLGYIAGIIDGEGSIMWTKGTHKHPYWMVRVGMTHEPVIRWLAQFGGKVNTWKDPRPESVRKRAWHWHVSRKRDVHTLLTALLPYLIVKKERAEECLAGPEMQEMASFTTSLTGSLPPIVRQRRTIDPQ